MATRGHRTPALWKITAFMSRALNFAVFSCSTGLDVDFTRLRGQVLRAEGFGTAA
ncbi:hypothetical protein PYK79_51145 [Streptomyces sp. ID05-04B]|nr:hypothetical protein [Streptomyces sp. ID05-04B]